jgi:hypothetical protein
MDENETSENTTSTLDRIKTGAEVVVIAYVAVTAAKGLYDLGRDWKDVLKEKRNARKTAAPIEN